MNRFVRSGAYARARVVTGGLFVLFGIVIAVRTVLVIGLVAAAVVPFVMAAALIVLGLLRLRDYVTWRGSQQ